ncbi:hypothetical protein M422DRAFT_28716 [Sphaerobolus stellatus SS14]|uniref:F-box domain-containing protein n=1 Tax=Sphaerobolus stellatus (strain SS14) TaxID=990650 RepID=A0A0C9UW83_SPHS4|nr:hypothetical protein M422DRAFT_28716 [Sphaerobolus stellatus SS14]
MPPPTSFSSFPADLIAHIVEDVDDVADLLSLALTCRAFGTLIIPWHIEYRWISCCLSVDWTDIRKVLSILSTKPFLAARLRILELINDKDQIPVLPRSLSKFPEYDKAPDVDQLETIDILVSHLTNLISHTNNLTHLIYHSLNFNVCPDFNLLVTLFEHSPVLQEADINARVFVVPLPPHTKDSHELKLYHKRPTMISLRAVSLVISYSGDTLRSVVHASELVDLLTRSCPSIVDLRLSLVGNAGPYPQFMLQGNWPKLARLTLGGWEFHLDELLKPQQTLIMRNFLSRHPTLRCLSVLRPGLIFEDSIAEGSLPNMQSFCLVSHAPIFDAILPVTVAANIRHLQVKAIPSSLPAIRLMTRLQTCVFTHNPGLFVSLTSLFDALSVSVERISIHSPETWKDAITETWLDTMGSLRRLRHLTHISHMFFGIDIEKPVGMDLMRQLGSILPGLLYVEAGYQGCWIRMQAIREQNGEYQLPSGTIINSRDWGDIFWGIESIRLRKKTRL